MSIWVLHLNLTPEEEGRIEERAYLTLPLGEVPDLSLLQNEPECRKLLQKLAPDDAPETLARRSERIWKLYAGVMPDDVIAVPLTVRKEVALAQVSGKYRYGVVGVAGACMHLVPVEWVNRLRLRTFGSHRDIFEFRGERMVEVASPQARAAIYRLLPHSYNRFVKFRWLLAVFFIMSLVRLAERVLHH